MGNINIQKVKKQIEINISIMIISVMVIYIGLICQLGLQNISWKDGLNAELVFVMISSLGSVVGWRIVEGIRNAFGYNLALVIFSGAFCLEYGMALVVKNSEAVKMFIFYSIIPFLFFYVFEQSRLLRSAAKREPQKKSNLLKYGR